jgi:hypothetical protein
MKVRIVSFLTATVASLGVAPAAGAGEPICTPRPEICVPERICIGGVCVREPNLLPGEDPCDGEPAADQFWCPFTNGIVDVKDEQDLRCDREISYVDEVACTIEDTLP